MQYIWNSISSIIPNQIIMIFPMFKGSGYNIVFIS